MATVVASKFDFKNWIYGEDKDACGYTLLHYVAAQNAINLALLLLEKEDFIEQINAEDNYGRTPLFWAFWSGNYEMAVLLLSKGAKFLYEDEIKDTPLHIGAQQGHSEMIKYTLFWLIKFDDEELTNTRMIIEAIKHLNEYQISPLEIAEENGNQELVNVFQAILEICTERILSKERTIKITDIVVRAGNHIGKYLSDLDVQVREISLELFEEYAVLFIRKEDGRNVRLKIYYDKIAFLILAKKDLRIEFTLTSVPFIEGLTVDGWKEMENEIFSTCLQFDGNVLSLEDLDRVRKIIQKSKSLQEFQEYCFCYKPKPTETGTLKKDLKNLQIKVKEEEEPKLTKLAALRQGIQNLNISKVQNPIDHIETKDLDVH